MPRHRLMLAGGLATVVAAAGVVISLTFANDSAAAEPGTGTQLISVDAAGKPVKDNPSSEPSISADGRYVAFATDEPIDMVDKIETSPSGDGQENERTPDTDVYVRDTVAGTTELVSFAPFFEDGGPVTKRPARGPSDSPSISANGRFIAFRTEATNIVATGSSSIISVIVLCDRDAGNTGKLGQCTFRRISDEVDLESFSVGARNPHLSADGSRVSFDVDSINVISFAPSRRAVLDQAVNVNVAPPNPDGNDTTNAGWIEVVNLAGTTGVPPASARSYLTAPHKLTINGAEHQLGLQSDSFLAPGGLHVAFVAQYFLPDEAEATSYTVWDYDLGAPATANGLTRLDQDGKGGTIATPGREFSHPTLSGDGRRYAFTDRQSAAAISVRLYDRGPDLSKEPTVDIASRTTAGAAGLGAQPSLSADGRYLAFTTPSAGMHDGTDPSQLRTSCLGPSRTATTYCDVVVRDVVLDQQREAAKPPLPRLPAALASPSIGCLNQATPCEGTGDSGEPFFSGDSNSTLTSYSGPVLSADGSYVAYASSADDLVAADGNKLVDVFSHQFRPSLTGDPVDFGQIPLGTEALKDVTLTHVGDGPLLVTGITVTGADFDLFPGETCTTAVLHAGDTCKASVRFKPTVLGTRTGTLNVTIRGLAAPLTIALTGIGVPPPVGILSGGPGNLDFGTRTVLSTSPVQSVNLTNTGTAAIAIGVVALGAPTATTFPGDYQKPADTCANTSLAPGASCKIDLRHRPVAVGPRPAVLTIAYDGTLTLPVTLTGAGAVPTLKSSPTVTPAGRVIQVSGTGFPAGSTSKLSLTGMPGTTTAKAAADGTFTVPFVVLPNTWTGHHELNADVLAPTAPGLGAPMKATLKFTIVPGSPIPPDFGIRK